MVKIENFEELDKMVCNKDTSKVKFVFVTSDTCMVCHSILNKLEETKEELPEVGHFIFTQKVVQDWLKSEFFKNYTTVPILVNLSTGEASKPESYENFKNLLNS